MGTKEIKYYNENCQEYIEFTINCDMSDQYAYFEKYLKPGCSILDVII